MIITRQNIAMTFLALLLVIGNAQAQGKNGHAHLNGSGATYEYGIVFVPAGNSTEDIVKIYMRSEYDGEVKLVIDALDYSASKELKAGQMTEFELTAEQAYATSAMPCEESIISGRAIHIMSDRELTIYSELVSESASAKLLVFPFHSAGKEYTVSTLPNVLKGDALGYGFSACMGIYEKTKVRFTLNSTTYNAKTSGGLENGQWRDFTMTTDDVLIITAEGDGVDLSGSLWSATKPIIVYSGYAAASITNLKPDYCANPELSTQLWDNFFYVPPAAQGITGFLRIYANSENTVVSINGEEYDVLNDEHDSPSWIEVPMGDEPMTIESDNNVYVTQLYISVFKRATAPLSGAMWAMNNAEIYTAAQGDVKLLLTYQSEDGLIPDDMKFTIAEESYPINEMAPGPGQEYGIEYKGKKFYYQEINIVSIPIISIYGNTYFHANISGKLEHGMYMYNTNISSSHIYQYSDTCAPNPEAVLLQ